MLSRRTILRFVWERRVEVLKREKLKDKTRKKDDLILIQISYQKRLQIKDLVWQE
jgi:hypothetical protein